MRLEPHGRPKLPPDDTPALYVRMFRDRYGAAGLAKLGAKKMLGLKI
jgi:hypothetical protein